MYNLQNHINPQIQTSEMKKIDDQLKNPTFNFNFTKIPDNF